MKLSQKECTVLMRRDFYTFSERSFYELNPTTKFLHADYIHILASFLEACRLGNIRRLIINLPPRSLKSHLASIVLPAWWLGHDPSTQIICASYAQPLAEKLASDCRSVMMSPWYRKLFPHTRLIGARPAVEELITTRKGFRLATSVGGVLTGRGADVIIIDDPLKPDEAVSETRRRSANDWFNNTAQTRLNDKQNGCIIIVQQRLHEDDLVGHVLGRENWVHLRFPAIAEEDEEHEVDTILGKRTFRRRAGEALHPEREPLELLQHIRETQGEYNFAGQYQQSPAPQGGGMVKTDWFRQCSVAEFPPEFGSTFQSWDTANKVGELNDFSVCTTWGVKGKNLYLRHVFRKRLTYPELKRAVAEQAQVFSPSTILVEDRASGTQLIQDLIADRIYEVKAYRSDLDKVMRMHSVTNMIENGFVFLPDKAPWLQEYLHEMACFPNGKFDDQADSTSQALDWSKQGGGKGWIETIASDFAKCKREGGVWVDPLYGSVHHFPGPRKT